MQTTNVIHSIRGNTKSFALCVTAPVCTCCVHVCVNAQLKLWVFVCVNIRVIHCHLSSCILAKEISHAVKIMASKQVKSGVSADGCVCFELQGPFRALCPTDQ